MGFRGFLQYFTDKIMRWVSFFLPFLLLGYRDEPVVRVEQVVSTIALLPTSGFEEHSVQHHHEDGVSRRAFVGVFLRLRTFPFILQLFVRTAC